ncbi:hypothetical protein Ahy_A06g026215 isoform A [Arachis hypogaea]|uniref:Thaumatin-like protein n=1 Tax=Arachis hypogaea TaxID=3818 RepID=A0A445CJR1_ARAHY|nr:hypothetical protein Ahy_A06g026215 isoform A [Arachis hypogaea]
MDHRQVSVFISLLLTLHLSLSGVMATTFTLVNKCDYTVWPGILSNAGVSPLSTTGFVLQPGQSTPVTAAAGWGGRFWGRTLCSQDSTGKFSCVTGDCGSGKLECSGNGATPPATLAEFTLDGSGGLDFFDVSLVDGYNVPMLVAPSGGSGAGNCTATGCVGDLNGACPSELRVMNERTLGLEFGHLQFASTVTVLLFSNVFVFTCQKASNEGGSSASSLLDNGTMVYQGFGQSEISWATCTHVFQSRAIAAVVGVTMAVWRFSQLI